MPKIKSVIQADRPFNAEKDMLRVIDDNPYFVWSTSLEDLEELACWMMNRKPRGSLTPEILEIHPSDGPVTLNSRFKVKVLGLQVVGGGVFDTPTLRTVRDTLLNLYKKGLICKIDLHGGYYASFKKEKDILKRIKQKDKFEFLWTASNINRNGVYFEDRVKRAEVDLRGSDPKEPIRDAD